MKTSYKITTNVYIHKLKTLYYSFCSIHLCRTSGSDYDALCAVMNSSFYNLIWFWKCHVHTTVSALLLYLLSLQLITLSVVPTTHNSTLYTQPYKIFPPPKPNCLFLHTSVINILPTCRLS